jgi:type IV pilus assembly protein PilW
MKRNFGVRQSGASLMEVLIAMSISLVVTASMVALMANSLGSTTRIVHMTKLTDDMRVAMQMMTRDLRRTSYNANALLCYGNEDCALDGSITAAADVQIIGGDCLWFDMDRGHDGDSTNDEAGGFRRRAATVGDETIGWIEMYTGATQPSCTEADGADGWVAITDPEKINITAFTVDDSLSYTQLVLQDVNDNEVSQRVRKIRMNLQGQLVLQPTITRTMQDIISVRNDFISISAGS